MKRIASLLIMVLLLSANLYAQETEKSALEKAKEAEEHADYEMALKWFKKANKLNPQNATTYYDITWCQNELGLYKDAVLTATEGAKIKSSVKLFNEHAFALYKLGKYKEAIEQYKSTLSITPEEPTAIKGIADSYFDNKEYNEAEVYYRKCLEIGKEPKVANYKIGYIMNENKKYQKAVDYELAAIKLDSEYAPAYNELGYAYSQLNKKSLALDNYIKASNLNPNHAIYLSNVGDMYYGDYDFKDLDKAMEYYKKSLAVENTNAITNYRIAWILNEKQKYEDAKRYLYKAVELKPQYSEAWIELGWIDYSQKNYSAAESDYLKALQFDTNSELARYYLGQVYIKQNKNSSAQKMIDELKSMNSGYAEKLKAKM